MQALEATLGIDNIEEERSQQSFMQLGGDSLAATQFTRQVNDLCGVSIPVSFVLDHSTSLSDVVAKGVFAARSERPACCTLWLLMSSTPQHAHLLYFRGFWLPSDIAS